MYYLSLVYLIMVTATMHRVYL